MNATRDSELDTLIQEVLDGVATPADRARLDGLLEGDRQARDRYAELRATFAELDALTRIWSSPDMPRRVRPRRAASVRASRALLVAAAVAALALGLGLWPTVGDHDLAWDSTGALVDGDPRHAAGAVRWSHRDLAVELRAARTERGLRVHVTVDPSDRLPDRGVPVEFAFDPQRWRVVGLDTAPPGSERTVPGVVRALLFPGRREQFAVALEPVGADRRPAAHVDVSVSARAVVHDMRLRVENPPPITNSGGG